MATATQQPTQLSAAKAITTGILAGLGGGLVFGAMMAMQGMLPMVAMLVRSENPLVGFAVHLLISVVIGALYGLVAVRLPQTYGVGIVAGALNGVVWWVLGALILMPLMLGMNDMVLQIGSMQWMSLIGHLVFGVLTGVIFVPLVRR